MDRRRIQRRLKKLKTDLSDLEKNRKTKRGKRVRSGVKQISLVGYTNAGKSTLMNALTGAGVLVDDRLFSTLDPTVRRLTLPDGREVVITDTVGFVRKLPHQLVEAFRSTLEETLLAELVIHVVDSSQPEHESQAAAVEGVLLEIGGEGIPRIVVLNKCDLIDDATRERISKGFPDGLFVSSLTGEGIDNLLEAIRARLDLSRMIAEFNVPFERGDIRALLFAEGEILEETTDTTGTRIVVRISPAMVPRLSEFLAQPKDAAS